MNETGENTNSSTEKWEAEIKSRYLSEEKHNKASTWLISRKSGSWWRCCVRIANLPWFAITTVLICCGLSGFVVISILGSAANSQNTNSYIPQNGTNLVVVKLITVECETDVSIEECESRVKERAQSSDFQNAMTETHLFTTLIVCWIGVFIFLVTKAMRSRKRKRYLECLPQHGVAVWMNSQPTTSEIPSTTTTTNTTTNNNSNNLPQEAISHNPELVDRILQLPIQYEMERLIKLSKFLHTSDPVCVKAGDPNWGNGPRRRGVHFRTSLLSSLSALDHHATQLDPSLQCGSQESIRQYIRRLQVRFSTLEVNHDHLNKLLFLYELAKYSQTPITEDMFVEFGNSMYQLSLNFKNLTSPPPVALSEAGHEQSSSSESESFAVFNLEEDDDDDNDDSDDDDDDTGSVCSDTALQEVRNPVLRRRAGESF